MNQLSRTTTDGEPVARRQVLRWGTSAALLAWSVPTVITWSASGAEAVSPVPVDDREGTPTREGTAASSPRPGTPGSLAATGGNPLPLAVIGAAAVATGAVIVTKARTASPQAVPSEEPGKPDPSALG